MKIGFIGLGTMGAGMASNLQKAGHDLVVHDLTRQAASRHLNAGAIWADKAEYLPACNREIDVLHRCDGAEAPAEASCEHRDLTLSVYHLPAGSNAMLASVGMPGRSSCVGLSMSMRIR